MNCLKLINPFIVFETVQLISKLNSTFVTIANELFEKAQPQNPRRKSQQNLLVICVTAFLAIKMRILRAIFAVNV